MKRVKKDSLSPEEMERIALEFENRDFTPEELARIAGSRRSTPGSAPAAAHRPGVEGASGDAIEDEQGRLRDDRCPTRSRRGA